MTNDACIPLKRIGKDSKSSFKRQQNKAYVGTVYINDAKVI